MSRALLAAGSLLAGFLPLTAAALGLGEIRLDSHLNQPFSADIPVRGDTPEEMSQLTIRLAPRETFTRFGLDRPAFMDDFNIEVDSQGISGTIRIRSTRPVAEPFVSMLLEVSWPTGRLLREYTVLLDPPAFARESVPSVSAAPAQAGDRASGAVERQAAAPPVSTEPVSTQAPGTSTGTSAGPSGSTAPARAAAPDSYTVRTNDTLWRVADSLRPSPSVSHNQMMIALYRANPEAFAGNINLLNAGAVLRVPDAGSIEAVSAGDANAEVSRQYADWRESREAARPTLELVPPAERDSPLVEDRPAPAASPAASATGAARERAAAAGDGGDVAALEAELDEARRLLTIRDNELRALQDQIRGLGDEAATAAEPLPDSTPPGAPLSDAAPADAVPEGRTARPATAAEDAVAAESADAAVPAAAPTATRQQRSMLDRLGEVVFNVWFLAAAAIALLAGLFVVFSRRREASTEDFGDRYSTDLRSPMASAAALEVGSPDSFIVEEGAAASTAGAPAGRPVASPGAGTDHALDAETPLERTITTEADIDLGGADVLAEADFHTAYGLYDQAAELLEEALQKSPGRRDLRLKLLEVLFTWENAGAFLKEARLFSEQTGATGADWAKVQIMGRQLCPGEVLFADGGVGAAAEPDVAFSEGPAGAVDVDFSDAGVGVDTDPDMQATGDGDYEPTRITPIDEDLLNFDIGGDEEPADGDGTRLEQTQVAFDPSGGHSHTTEMPTLESPGFDSMTMETPTMESPAFERGSYDGTVESPTLETRAGSTVESPTLESAAPGSSGSEPGDFFGGGADHTEEINMEDLGLDLSGLDQAAGELSETVDDGSGAFGGLDDETPDDVAVDSTAEMPGFGFDDGTQDLPAAASDEGTQDLPAVAPDEGFAEIFDGDDDDPVEQTSIRSGLRRGPDGPTMTEIGTKLDLARAYVDMGDPDGARSILNEVLEEGDGGQRQQARQLLDDLAD